MSKNPTLQQMLRSDRIDEAAIKAYLSGQPIDPLFLWHAPGVPTFANALQLDQQLGLKKISSQVTQSSNGDYVAIVRLQHPTTKSVRAGAGRHADPLIARGFGFRNAVRQLLVEIAP